MILKWGLRTGEKERLEAGRLDVVNFSCEGHIKVEKVGGAEPDGHIYAQCRVNNWGIFIKENLHDLTK